MSKTLASSEFLMGVFVLVSATVLLALGDISEDTWKWAATTVGGAYLLGRSAVKAVGESGTAKIEGFKADLQALVSATPPEETSTRK